MGCGQDVYQWSTNAFKLLQLNATKNLVDQCVQGEGLVQVNVEITNKDGELLVFDLLVFPENVSHVHYPDIKYMSMSHLMSMQKFAQ